MYCLDFFLRTFGLVGYDAPFTRERSRVRFAQGVTIINIPLWIKIKIYYNINIYICQLIQKYQLKTKQI